jgi:metallo-beta-lactamase class B
VLLQGEFMTGSPQESTTGLGPWWKRRLPLLLLLGITAAVLTGVLWWRPWQGYAPRPVTVSRILRPAPVAVSPGVYLLGKTAPAAAYLVETSAGLVLIDSGLEVDPATITAQVRELGFDIQNLQAILLTHVHADHSLGAARLRERTGARVYAGRGDCPPLRRGGPREAFFSTYDMADLSPHPTPVDVALAGGETIPFGEARFAVIATPGHTPGSVCYLLERGDLRVLFTGDVIQALDRTTPGALGTYTTRLPPRYRGNLRDYLASLRRLRALPVPDLILPGHPKMDRSPQNPHLGKARWRALLDQGIAELERWQARYRADGANFLDNVPRELLPGLHYLGRFGGSAVYCLATPKGLFLFDAPGGPALVDFLARRFDMLGWNGRQPTAVLLTSADRGATAGLSALVKESGCQVVAPGGARDRVRQLCPAETRILSADDLAKNEWFTVQVIPLQGRGTAPVAYQVSWAGKTVLLSGRIPVKSSYATFEQLVRVVKQPGGSVEQYAQSLDRLARLKPNLWLPAVPVHGQNANLYDDDWYRVLAQNRQLMQMIQ